MYGGVSENGGGAERIGEHETKSYVKASIVQVGGQSMAYPGPKDFLSQANFSHVKWDCCEGCGVRGGRHRYSYFGLDAGRVHGEWSEVLLAAGVSIAP